MSKNITSEEELKAAVADADPLNKAWALELVRIHHKTAKLEFWEQVLVDLTLELGSTMKKVAHRRELKQYDHFLIEQLRLLVLPNPDDPEADREKALAMVGLHADRKQLPRPAVGHMQLGHPLDESTRKTFRHNVTRMSREAQDPASDFDRWHMRIMVVLLTAALGGRDVNVLAEATGYPRSFIEHVWRRTEETGIELNPLNWIDDEGT